MSSKKRTAADDKTLVFQPRRSRRGKKAPQKIEQMDPLVHGALSVVFQQKGMLHWSDAIMLGSTSKELRGLWKEKEEEFLTPLLAFLEGMVGGIRNKENGSGDEDDAGVGDKEEDDPDEEDNDEDESNEDAYDDEDEDDVCLLRDLHPNYYSFPVVRKCEEMVSFLETMVGNMQNHNFCSEDPSNPAKNKECDPTGWLMGDEFETETVFLNQHAARRGTLVLNIAIFSFAVSAMKQGGDYYFNEVFRGEEGASLGGGSCYGHVICHMISCMFPFRDEDLVEHLRANYPSLEELQLLGLVLTNKVVLFAPFFRWAPPSDDKDDGTWFKNLPTPLEPLNEDNIRALGMGQYLVPHDGIDY